MYLRPESYVTAKRMQRANSIVYGWKQRAKVLSVDRNRLSGMSDEDAHLAGGLAEPEPWAHAGSAEILGLPA